jgi:hypothetical protein
MWRDELKQIYKKLIAIDVKLDMMLNKVHAIGKKVDDVRQEAANNLNSATSGEVGRTQVGQREKQ